MPKVPRSNVSQFPGAAGDMPMAPSESDLMMALAIMHGKGRITSKLDPTKQGQVEDRRDVEQPELARLRSSLGNMGLPQDEPLDNLKGSQMAKDAGIGDIGKIRKSTASLGVAGGSR